MIGAYKPPLKKSFFVEKKLLAIVGEQYYNDVIDVIEQQLNEDFDKQKGLFMKGIIQKILLALTIAVAFFYGYLKAFEYFTGVKFTLWQENAPTTVVETVPAVEPIPDTTAEDLRALIMALRDVNRVYQDQDLGSIVARQSAQAAVVSATNKLRAIPIDFQPGAADTWYYAMLVEGRVAVYIVQKGSELSFHMVRVGPEGRPDEGEMTSDTSLGDAVKTLKTLLESA